MNSFAKAERFEDPETISTDLDIYIYVCMFTLYRNRVNEMIGILKEDEKCLTRVSNRGIF
jgi:hypothetical protein